MFYLLAICMFIGTLGYIDRRIVNNILNWLIFNVFFNLLYVIKTTSCVCMFYLNSVKSYIIFHFKHSKKDILIAHIKNNDNNNDNNNNNHDNRIIEYCTLTTQQPNNYYIVFYGHMINCKNTFTNTVHMQRFNKIPDTKPEYSLSNIRTHAINIRILENNMQWASYPVSLVVTKNNMIYNYLVVGNILFDKKFVNYWLKTYHAVVINENQNYDVNIINKDIEEIKITEGSYIKLTNDNYILCKTNDVPIDYEPVEL